MKKALLTVLLLTVCFSSLSFSAETTAPSFSLRDLKGKKQSLEKALKKGPVIISFWATWCGPCLEELKALKPHYETLREESISFFAISIDQSKDKTKVKRIVKKYKFPYQILLDSDQRAFKKFHGKYPPLTLLIDEDGKVIYRHNRYQKGDERVLLQKVSDLAAKNKGETNEKN